MRRFNPEKELNKVQYGDRNKLIGIIVSLLVIIAVGSTYALYQVRHSSKLIYTVVQPFNNKDINLAVYIDDQPSDDFPKKNSGYIYDKIVCDNKSTAKFDSINWALILKAKAKDKCNVYFITDANEEGKPNAPELYQGLIPVIIESNGTLKVADGTTDWYNYDEKRWANAVLVKQTNYSKYVQDGEYLSNKTIPIEEVLQMYVWIPRYKYQLWNAKGGNSSEPQIINIQFESGISTTGTVKCSIASNGKETCENDENGEWYTHPAFTFGNTDLTGIWVGKFESSGNNTDLKIIPNVVPILNVNILYMFDASRSIEETYAVNFNINKDEIDTHMMKNSEWGAMAYLTQSKYGRCDNGICTEIAMNSQKYRTGYDNTGSLWNTANGIKASTTGNMYGIYDTNGNGWEYVMANMVDINGNDTLTLWSNKPNNKYYDIYEYGTSQTDSTRGHLGDATREILKTVNVHRGGWYNGYTPFMAGNAHFLRRGGYSTDVPPSGIFSFACDDGTYRDYIVFRVVLTAQDGED